MAHIRTRGGYFATGHYAKIIYEKKFDLYKLQRGRDVKKEQSYVLYMLNQKQLAHILLPLGSMTKQQIKKKAKQLKLPINDSDESQDICFIKNESYIDFIRRQVKGFNPETGKIVKAGLGRFGPYILHDGKFASLKEPHNVLDVALETAIEVLAAAPTRTTKKPLRDLGEHPEDGNPIRILTGRYGPYIKHNKLNASIPNRFDPKTITIEEALELLEKKAQKKKAKKKSKTPTKRKKKATTTRKKKSTNTKKTPPINPAAPIS